MRGRLKLVDKVNLPSEGAKFLLTLVRNLRH